MGFLQAIRDIGVISAGEGLEPYLKYPLPDNGKFIRVFLDVEDIEAMPLRVRGIAKVDLADQIQEPGMKTKLLFKERVGANVNWGFTPLFRLERSKCRNADYWLGSSGNWRDDSKAFLNKLQNKVLQDYEKEGVLDNGAAERIVSLLADQVDNIASMLEAREPYAIIFGVSKLGDFLYPGEIDAFVKYFSKKLDDRINQNKGGKHRKLCSLCSNELTNNINLESVFAFATKDKVNFLPGLNDKQESMFSICQDCHLKLSAGRERVESQLTITGVVPKVNIWVIPEAFGARKDLLGQIITNMEQIWSSKALTTLGVQRETRYLERLPQQNTNLLFHFLFWEQNNRQELIHMMVEDVPPERLAVLEDCWGQAMRGVLGDVSGGINLDWAVRSLYDKLNKFCGESKSDRVVAKDFSLKVIGKMLKGTKLPVATFKQFVTRRFQRLIHENDDWDEIKKTSLYAQIWVDYMTLINRG